MAYPDMRAFMRRLEDQGQLVCVRKEVSPHLELGVICRELADRNGPAALFTNVAGSPLPVLVNLFGTRERAATALEIPEAELLSHWRKALAAYLLNKPGGLPGQPGAVESEGRSARGDEGVEPGHLVRVREPVADIRIEAHA